VADTMATSTRSQRRAEASAATRSRILESARACLLADGYGSLSTRRVAEAADVPLSQIHYYFGSKQELILSVLRAETERLVDRQASMFAGDEPLWRRWERACDYLEDDLQSGYVRVLQELIAAGWSDPVLAAGVRAQLAQWFDVLTDVAEREVARGGSIGPFTPREIAALMGLPFTGAEAVILLGLAESELPTRSALRKVSAVLRAFANDKEEAR
jgi:AcrR family transcriptional regulator